MLHSKLLALVKVKYPARMFEQSAAQYEGLCQISNLYPLCTGMDALGSEGLVLLMCMQVVTLTCTAAAQAAGEQHDGCVDGQRDTHLPAAAAPC